MDSNLYCRLPTNWGDDPSQCLHDWQTLLGSLAAVLVGGLTVLLIHRQVTQASEHFERSKKAKLQVARTKLPIASSEIAKFAKECVNKLDQVAPSVEDRSNVSLLFEKPSLPSLTEKVLDAYVESADDDDGIFTVAAFYSEWQTLMVRIEGVFERPRQCSLIITDCYIQAAIIYALAMKLLMFGRREVETIEPINWKDIDSSAKFILTRGNQRARALKKIQEKMKQKRPIPFALNKNSNDRS